MQKSNMAFSVERIAYRKKIIYPIRYLLYALSIFIFGCATTPPINPPAQYLSPTVIYHQVQKGETLWRISKMYNRDLNELIKTNNISDYTKIETGQKIIIPKSPERKPVINNSTNDDFLWPLKGRIITSFGQVFNGIVNKGINITSNPGSNVTASRSGKVAFYCPNFNDLGKTIIIDHGDGFLTLYARNSEVLVKAGDFVQRGLVIAKVGNAGKDKNVYLHFEIRKNHTAQNPNFYLPH